MFEVYPIQEMGRDEPESVFGHLGSGERMVKPAHGGRFFFWYWLRSIFKRFISGVILTGDFGVELR